MIQESKITNLREDVAKSFWSKTNIGYSFSNALGMSGGINNAMEGR